MALTVWKRVLISTDEQEIMVPAGAEFLCAREQHEQICVWFRCDPRNPDEKRAISIRGTGHANAEGCYLGTASLYGGSLMFHVFERIA